MTGRISGQSCFGIWILSFEFVSDFGFGISDFRLFAQRT
jgi:hypothetical protein